MTELLPISMHSINRFLIIDFWKVRITNIKLSKDEYNKLFQSMIYPNSGKVGKSIANRRIRRSNDTDGEYPIAPNRRYINSKFAYSLWDWEW